MTYGDIREATDWTKFGGFSTAAKRAGLVLHQCREQVGGERDTRFFAVPADDIRAGRVFAYFCGPDGCWLPVGDYAGEGKAVRFAQVEAPKGVTIEAARGRHGELYLVPTGSASAEASAVE